MSEGENKTNVEIQARKTALEALDKFSIDPASQTVLKSYQNPENEVDILTLNPGTILRFSAKQKGAENRYNIFYVYSGTMDGEFPMLLETLVRTGKNLASGIFDRDDYDFVAVSKNSGLRPVMLNRDVFQLRDTLETFNSIPEVFSQRMANNKMEFEAFHLDVMTSGTKVAEETKKELISSEKKRRFGFGKLRPQEG